MRDFKLIEVIVQVVKKVCGGEGSSEIDMEALSGGQYELIDLFRKLVDDLIGVWSCVYSLSRDLFMVYSYVSSLFFISVSAVSVLWCLHFSCDVK